MSRSALSASALGAELAALRGAGAAVRSAAIDPFVPFRPRRKRSKPAREVGFNITPMIDMTFLLLTFYILASSFEQSEGVLASRMPRSGAVASVALPISPVVVRVQQVGVGPNDFSVAIEGAPQRPASFEELTGLLRQIQQKPGFDSETPVVIQADQRVRWDHIVNVWNSAVRARFRNIAFSEE
ncbi:MAG TPA: biopolymer transporter ExbD [Phycisphaerae bacterium]|jgi:biopolymer transport protein ExbD